MLGAVVAIATWAVGDLLVWRWGLSGLRERLTRNQVTARIDDGVDGVDGVATVTSLLGPAGVVITVVGVLALAAWTWRDEFRDAVATKRSMIGPLAGVRLGAATAVTMVAAWLLVRWHGFDYPFGTSSVPTQVWSALVDDAQVSWWIPLALVSVVPGAAVAALGSNLMWLRGESAGRYGQLAAGGLVMGVGAGIAGGCNLGHSMVGVPLLSIGSIVTTVAIASGVFVAHQVADRLARSSDSPQ